MLQSEIMLLYSLHFNDASQIIFSTLNCYSIIIVQKMLLFTGYAVFWRFSVALTGILCIVNTQNVERKNGIDLWTTLNPSQFCQFCFQFPFQSKPSFVDQTESIWDMTYLTPLKIDKKRVSGPAPNYSSGGCQFSENGFWTLAWVSGGSCCQSPPLVFAVMNNHHSES